MDAVYGPPGRTPPSGACVPQRPTLLPSALGPSVAARTPPPPPPRLARRAPCPTRAPDSRPRRCSPPPPKNTHTANPSCTICTVRTVPHHTTAPARPPTPAGGGRTVPYSGCGDASGMRSGSSGGSGKGSSRMMVWRILGGGGGWRLGVGGWALAAGRSFLLARIARTAGLQVCAARVGAPAACARAPPCVRGARTCGGREGPVPLQRSRRASQTASGVVMPPPPSHTVHHPPPLPTGLPAYRMFWKGRPSLSTKVSLMAASTS